MEERLYIDGELVDLGTNTNITLDIRSNVFRDVSKMTTNTTYTIKLPKTVRNLRIFGNADMVSSDSRHPYTSHIASMYRNGIEIIRNGKVLVLSMSGDIEISISWGVTGALDKLIKGETTLNELQTDKYVKLNRENKIEDYEKAIEDGVFYADYDPMLKKESEEEWVSYRVRKIPKSIVSLSLDDLDAGGISTGTEIGAIINTAIDPLATDMKCKVLSFAFGATAQINYGVGKSGYSTFAILDSNGKILDMDTQMSSSASMIILEAPVNAKTLIVNILIASSSNVNIIILGGTVEDNGGDAFSNGDPHFRRDNLHPVVTAGWINNLIKESNGISLDWDETEKEFYKTLGIPLVSKKSDTHTLSQSAKIKFNDATQIGLMSVATTDGNDVFSVSSDGRTLTANASASLTLDIEGEWGFNVEDAVTKGQLLGGKALFGFYPNYIEMRIKKNNGDTEPSVYNIGVDGELVWGTEDDLVMNRLMALVAGYGKIDLEQGDIIELEIKNRGGTLAQMYTKDVTFNAEINVGETVPLGGNFPIGINLPEIKIVDYIKFLCAITGTFPLNIEDESTLKFAKLSALYDNKANALDWSRKLFATGGDNKPSDLEYKVDDFCQNNWYRWKDDDTVMGFYDGNLKVDNNSLENTRDVVTFPFAASNGNNVPMYEASDEEVNEGFHADRKDNNTDSAPSYKKCQDRILNVIKNASGKAALRFGLDMQEIIDMKYDGVKRMLSSARVIKDKFILSDIDISEFDETIPIYLSQYGAYFAVLEIKSDGKDTADVTMIELI